MRLFFLSFSLLLAFTHLSVYASEDVYSNRIESDFQAELDKWIVGTRMYINDDISHLVIRYNVNKKSQLQYRHVTKNDGDDREHWMRFQHKTFKYKFIEFRAVAEHRFKEERGDTARIRPKTIVSRQVSQNAKLFYSYIPHMEYSFDDSEFEYKFGQHSVGVDFKFGNVKFTPYFKYHTDKSWNSELFFWGFNLSAKQL